MKKILNMSEVHRLNNRQMREKIKKLFNSAMQQPGHQSIITSAKKLYSSEGCDIFLDEFINVLKYCLVYNNKFAVEKMLSFVSKFVASLYTHETLADNSNSDLEIEVEHPFIVGLLMYLSKAHWAANIDARVRCVTLMHYILIAMPENSSIPLEMWKILADTTRCRLQDRNANVRVAAVLLARKLQEPRDPKCEIMRLLSFHMNDPSPPVRRAVISSIALIRSTIVQILERTLDVNENVRRNAFAVVAKITFLRLAIAHRLTILERGLKDRAEKVRSCIEKVLIPHWLEQVDKDVVKFLESLDAVNCHELTTSVVQSILRVETTDDVRRSLPLDCETKLIPYEVLTPETSLLWKSLAQYYSANEFDEEFEGLLPSLTAFCIYIRRFNEVKVLNSSEESKDKQWLILQQRRTLLNLLHITKLFDLRDEMGRMNLRKLLIEQLENPIMSNTSVEYIVQLLFHVIPCVNDFFTTLAEVISDLREPIAQVAAAEPIEVLKQREVEISCKKITLNELKEQEYKAVQSKNYQEAAACQDQIDEITKAIAALRSQPTTILSEVREEKNDPETLCRCLTILVEMIKVSAVKNVTVLLRNIEESLVPGSLRSEDLLTQSLAIQALAQFCILDKHFAQDHLLSFLFMLSESGENEINIPALKAVFDIFQVHGIDSFEKLDETRLDDSSFGERSRGKTLLLEEDEVLFNQDSNDREISRSGSKCVSVLKELLNCTTNEELQRTAFEGFCKLLISGVIYSPSLLKSIILKGFTPIRGSESDDKISQLFMVFFPVFASHTIRSQEMIEAAFIPVMRSLCNAPLGSPEADINPRDVATFLVDQTKTGTNHTTSSTVHVHNSWAIAICLEVLRDISLNVDLGFHQNYLRALFLLNLSLESEPFVQQMLTLVAKISREIKDSNNQRLLKQFRSKLNFCVRGNVESIQNTLQTTTQTSISNSSRLTNPTNDMPLNILPEYEEKDESITNLLSPNCQEQRMVAESPEISDCSSEHEDLVDSSLRSSRRQV